MFPPCYLPVAKLGGGNEDNGDLLQKVPCMHCCTQCPQPCSRPPLTHASAGECSNTHRQVWVSLWWGHCSFLLGPGAQGSVCALQEPISQSCVSSGSSIMGLMATSSKRAYATPKSAAPRAPVPVAVHCWPVPPQKMLKHSSISVSVGSLGPDAYKNLQGLSITLD